MKFEVEGNEAFPEPQNKKFCRLKKICKIFSEPLEIKDFHGPNTVKISDFDASKIIRFLKAMCSTAT